MPDDREEAEQRRREEREPDERVVTARRRPRAFELALPSGVARRSARRARTDRHHDHRARDDEDDDLVRAIGLAHSRSERAFGEAVDELPHARLGRSLRLVRRAVEDELAAVHHADAIGDGEEAIEIARHHDDRGVRRALLVAEELEDLLRGDRIEAGGRLVVEDDRGLRDRRARDADALLLTAGEARGHAVLEAGERDAREPLVDARLDLVLGEAREAPQRERDVVADGHVIEERVVLEEHPELEAHLLELELGGLP